MLNKEAAEYFVKDKTAKDIAESMMRGANAPAVVQSLTLVIEAYGKACAAQERAPLRAACEYALAIAEDRTPGTWDDVMRAMRAALATARGGTQ